MSDKGDKQLKTALLESIRVELTGAGFISKTPKETFYRRYNGIVEVFQLVCLDGQSGWRIQPNVGIRIDCVEEIFHRTSGFDLKYQKDTPTIGNAIGAMVSGDNRACEYLLEKRSEVVSVTEKIVRVFHAFALPYFARFNSLAAIDAELNDKPTERTPQRVVPWLRCATGVIVAKLTGRINYNQLVEIYTDVMSNSEKGFYFGRFQALVKSLEEKSPIN